MEVKLSEIQEQALRRGYKTEEVTAIKPLNSLMGGRLDCNFIEKTMQPGKIHSHKILRAIKVTGSPNVHGLAVMLDQSGHTVITLKKRIYWRFKVDIKNIQLPPKSERSGKKPEEKK